MNGNKRSEPFKLDRGLYDVKFEKSETVKQYHKKRRFVKIFSFLVLVLVSILVYLLFFSSIANITNVYISGDNLVEEDEILQVAEIKDYPNFYYSFKSKMRKKIIAHQLIKEAIITKKNKSIYIEIFEIKPLLKIEDKYLFDNNLILKHDNVEICPAYSGSFDLLEDVDFLEELNDLYLNNYENFSRISEIIYNPHPLNQKELRLIMRDQNTVIVSYDDFAYKMGYYVDIILNINERMANTTGFIDLVSTIDCNEQCSYEFKPY